MGGAFLYIYEHILISVAGSRSPASRCSGGCDLAPKQLEQPVIRLERNNPVDVEEYRKHAAKAEWTVCGKCGEVRHKGLVVNECTGHNVVHIVCEKCYFANQADQLESGCTVKYYVTPAKVHWPHSHGQASYKSLWDTTEKRYEIPEYEQANHVFHLDDAEATALALLELKCDFKVVKGGRAPTSNKKKTSVIRAVWKACDVKSQLPSERAKEAFSWLMENNARYRFFYEMHKAKLAAGLAKPELKWRTIPTAELLLQLPGIEVAARPDLYPTTAFGDTDIKQRLTELGRITQQQKPSLKASFCRKLLSRCLSYQQDFALFALLYDVSLARQLTSVVSIAKEKKIAPDEAASEMQNFSGFWQWEREKLEDTLPIKPPCGS